jgi:hypothetical protein
MYAQFIECGCKTLISGKPIVSLIFDNEGMVGAETDASFEILISLALLTVDLSSAVLSAPRIELKGNSTIVVPIITLKISLLFIFMIHLLNFGMFIV